MTHEIEADSYYPELLDELETLHAEDHTSAGSTTGRA